MDADRQAVLASAAELVDAFGSHDRARYFSCFAPDATFVFYNSPEFLESREAFEGAWERWEREDGFRVLSCESSDQRVTTVGDAAVFTHRVATRSQLAGDVVESDERETIVFRREQGRWVAIHEHLSATPA